MKKFTILICFLTLFLGCTEEIEEIKYGSIAGVVYDESVGEPIPVVKLSLTPGGKQLLQVLTDHSPLLISKLGIIP